VVLTNSTSRKLRRGGITDPNPLMVGPDWVCACIIRKSTDRGDNIGSDGQTRPTCDTFSFFKMLFPCSDGGVVDLGKIEFGHWVKVTEGAPFSSNLRT
jgi:hypothetical protein